jgi:hypothetical protein
MYEQYWLGLYAGGDQEVIKARVETMMKTTIKILKKKIEGQAQKNANC